MKKTNLSQKTYQTDLRINATPHQVATAITRGGVLRRSAEEPRPDNQKRPASTLVSGSNSQQNEEY